MLTQNSSKKQTENKLNDSRLGIVTELPDTFSKNDYLDKFSKVLKRNNDKGLRDNYTLAEVSKTVLRMFINNPKNYIKYAKNKDKLPKFDRNLFCQNILDNFSIVKKTIEHDSVINTNIAYCGSVWTCPVCGSLIQNRRAEEVQQAIDYSKKNNYQVAMITYTASHFAHYSLIDFGQKLQMAYQKTQDQIKRLRKKYEIGNIKAVEYTYSERNGWHKHFHVIVIYKADADVQSIYEKIKSAWELQCTNVGLLSNSKKAIADFRAHSCNITLGADAAVSAYTNKSADEWTIADEMTKSVLKIGHSSEHITPFQMLVNIACDKIARPKLIDKYLEYALYTKGSHQIDWSNGLKKKVGIEEKSDESILEEHTDTAYNIAVLTVEHWHLLRSKYLRIQFREAAKRGYDSIVEFFKKYDAADVFDTEDADILEIHQQDKDEELTPSQFERLTILNTILEAVADAMPSTYTSSRYKPKHDEVYTSEEKLSIAESRNGLEKHIIDDFDFMPRESIKPIKSKEDIKREWFENHKPKPQQTNLF